MTGKTVNLVLDTNVFISAVFFSGIPYRILDAWRKGRVRLFVSRVILAEYHETGNAHAIQPVRSFSSSVSPCIFNRLEPPLYQRLFARIL